ILGEPGYPKCTYVERGFKLLFSTHTTHTHTHTHTHTQHQTPKHTDTRTHTHTQQHTHTHTHKNTHTHTHTHTYIQIQGCSTSVRRRQEWAPPLLAHRKVCARGRERVRRCMS